MGEGHRRGLNNLSALVGIHDDSGEGIGRLPKGPLRAGPEDPRGSLASWGGGLQDLMGWIPRCPGGGRVHDPRGIFHHRGSKCGRAPERGRSAGCGGARLLMHLHGPKASASRQQSDHTSLS